jgi:hypothetical protein
LKKLIASGLMAGALIGGSMGAVVPAAFASPSSSSGTTTMNGTTHCDPSSPLCLQGPPGSGAPPFNPVILVNPPTNQLLPPFVTVAPNCPSFITGGSWTLDFVSGDAVVHGTLNKNGDWGGATAQGQATLTSGATVEYSGHLQEWGGGGQNSNPGGQPTNQSVNGFTLNFKGSGIAGSISINANMHTTTNNSGTTTSSVGNGTVTCS